MTRSIDTDPFGPTIEEKIFRTCKRVCIVFAVLALSISALDLINASVVERASALIRDSRLHYAELPNRLLTGIHQISILPDQSSIIVVIPSDAIATAPKLATRMPATPKVAALPVPTPKIAAAQPAAPGRTSGKSDASPVAELAAARHWDAVEFAMAQPVTQPVTSEQLRQASLDMAARASPASAVSAMASVPPSEPIKLASIEAGSLPGSAMMAAPMPVSLPMSDPIPIGMVPIPYPAPGVPPPSPAQRLHLEGKEYAKAERCLANAIYWESRSEPIRGQEAVAQVVLNRVFSPFYPNDVCAVIYQNASRHLSCQFTFACDGKRKVINERGAWARANRIARQTLHGKIYVPQVAKSTHYHAVYVRPYWTREMRKMVRFGIHNFYRPYAWGNGADAPVWGRAALAENKKK